MVCASALSFLGEKICTVQELSIIIIIMTDLLLSLWLILGHS